MSWFKWNAIWLVATFTVILVGCSLIPHAKQAAKAGETDDVRGAIVGHDAKTDELLAAEQDREAKVKANIEHAQRENANAPDSPSKTIVDGDLAVALAWLDDIPADLREFAKRDEQRALANAGKLEEAIASYLADQAAAKKRLDEIAALRAEVATLRLERDTALQDLERKLEENRIANEKKIQAVVDKVNRRITIGLVIGAVVLLGVGVLFAYPKFQLGEYIKAAIAFGFWAGSAGCCAIFAWLINQPWFKTLMVWTFVSAAVIGLAALTIYVVAELKSAKEKKIRAVEADEAEDTLRHLINVGDGLPDDTTLGQYKAALSSGLTKMTEAQKALIHELRAEQKRAAA